MSMPRAATLQSCTDAIATSYGLMQVSAMCSDNLIYYSYVAFKTYEDLKDHLKQDATKKFIKCALYPMTFLYPVPTLLMGAVHM